MNDRSIVFPYVRPDRQTAYELYRVMDGRSLRKLADQTGIPFGTLAVWSREDRWIEQINTEQDVARRAIRAQADAWLVGKLPERLAQMEEEVKRIEDVYQPSDDGLIHVVKATPASVRAKLLTYMIDKALPTLQAINTRDSEDDTADPSTLSDDDLFAEVKRQANR